MDVPCNTDGEAEVNATIRIRIENDAPRIAALRDMMGDTFGNQRAMLAIEWDSRSMRRFSQKTSYLSLIFSPIDVFPKPIGWAPGRGKWVPGL